VENDPERHKGLSFCAKKIMLGKLLQAGLAFSNAILGAVHAPCHTALEGFLCDLPHGLCNAILVEQNVVGVFNMHRHLIAFKIVAQTLGIDYPRAETYAEFNSGLFST